MMLAALIMRPWLVRMIRLNLQPRVLAEDIHLSTSGEGHEERFAAGYNQAHKVRH